MLEHVSSAIRLATRTMRNSPPVIEWKSPGEENFKFDFLRVLLETEMPKHLKTTALYLATSFWPRGDVGIAHETVAQQMGVNERTVQTNLKVLVDLGWITCESGWRGKVNQYQGQIPDHIPAVRDAIARIEERQQLQDARKNSNVGPDLVIKFISRLYADKQLDQHLQDDLPEKAMKTLRKTVKQLLDSTAPDHEVAHDVLEEIATWPRPETIICRPLMFNGAIHHLVPSLRLNLPTTHLKFIDSKQAWPDYYVDDNEPF